MTQRNYKFRGATIACEQCQTVFTYTVKTGVRRRYCGRECAKAANLKRRTEQRRTASRPCSTPLCSGKVVFRARAGICENCYMYLRKTGKQRDPRPRPYRPRKRADGYQAITAPDHPLADTSKTVFVHRQVAYDTRGGVCGPCHWCGIPLTWKTARVDHLDDDRANNSPDNLVLACNDCNRWRGSLITFLNRITPDRVSQLIALIEARVGRRKMSGAA